MDQITPTVQKQLEAYPRLSNAKIASIVIVSALVIWSAAGVRFLGFNSKGFEVGFNLLRAMFNPDTGILFGTHEFSVLVLGFETIAIAFLGTILGAILAIPIAFLAARNIMPRFVNLFFQMGITGIRVFPAFVIAVSVAIIFGFNSLAGVVTMGITSIGMMTKLYVEAVEGINHNVLDAMDATGCTTFQKIRFGILPQLTAQFMSTAIYRFEINLKNAAVLGLVGAGGIGRDLISAIQNSRFEDASAYLIGLAVIVLFVEFFSNIIRSKLA